MTEQSIEKVESWDTDAGERSMQDGHNSSWNALIHHVSEKDYFGKSVLDFGCNRGGFLRLLQEKKGFDSGLGVDIATKSLEIARDNNPYHNLFYKHVEALDQNNESFDFVFSHEVIYLLSDLESHATQIHSLLKDGGVYYLAIGEHSDNPLWERWKSVVTKFSPVVPHTYSLQKIAKTFQDVGFEIEVKRMVCDGFLPYDSNDDKYLKSPSELIDFMTQYMMLFRLTKIQYVD
jgi:2-polyprenyl-3-methyl-5-hydroxy-6-metoxy-1,4-benzoquinol methylase